MVNYQKVPNYHKKVPETCPVFRMKIALGYSHSRRQVMSKGKGSLKRTLRRRCPTLIVGMRFARLLFVEVESSKELK